MATGVCGEELLLGNVTSIDGVGEATMDVLKYVVLNEGTELNYKPRPILTSECQSGWEKGKGTDFFRYEIRYTLRTLEGRTPAQHYCWGSYFISKHSLSIWLLSRTMATWGKYIDTKGDGEF